MTGRTLIVVALLALLFGLSLVWHESVRTPEVRLPLHEHTGRASPLTAGERTFDASSAGAVEDGGEATDEDLDARAAIEAASAAPPRPGTRPELLVRGRVIDRSGAPVAGAEITVSVSSADDSAPRQHVTDSDVARALQSRPAVPAAGKTASKKRPHARSGSDGRFVLRRRAFERSHLAITARHANFAPTKIYETWDAATPFSELPDVVLDVGATAMGRVVDAAQRPIEGVEVRFVSAPAAPETGDSREGNAPTTQVRAEEPGPQSGPPGLASLIEPVRTGEDGSFELRHLPPGTFLLHFDKLPYLPTVTDLLVAEPDATISCGKIRLTVGAEVSGQVRDPKGRPIAGVQVEATVHGVPSWEDRRWRRTEEKPSTPRDLVRDGVRRCILADEQGKFVLRGLPTEPLRFAFEHDDYIDEIHGPLDPDKRGKLDVTMHPRLVLAGRVVDRASGRPIESYGIAARRVSGWRGGPRASHRESPKTKKREPKRIRPRSPKARSSSRETPKSRARRLARERARELARAQKEAKKRAERDAIVNAIRRQTDYLRERLGPTGSAPLTRPRPTTREEGAFRLVGLQPGTYVLDILAPGHVHTAAGPFELVRGQQPPELILRIDRGVALTGRVVERGSGRPISGAQITLELPPLAGGALSSDPRVRARLRSVRTNARVARARSGSDGAFRFSGLRPGVYRLAAAARKHREYLVASLVVGSRPETPHDIRLERSASARGTVSNREPGADYSLTLYGKNGVASARVDRETGRYEITTLEPDEYFVLVRSSRGRDSRREKLELAVRKERGAFDVRAYPGADIQHDIDAQATVLGALSGRVSHNGRDAAGYGIQLVPEDAESSRSTSHHLRATTGDKGAFAFAYLAPGNYTLEVTPPRSRSRSPDAWHRERISIPSGSSLDERIRVRTGDLRFSVLDARSGLPVSRARIELVHATHAQGRTYKQWRRSRSARRVTVEDGAAYVRDLMPGPYVYAVSGAGLTSGPLHAHVAPGVTSVVVRAAPRTKSKKGAEAGTKRSKK